MVELIHPADRRCKIHRLDETKPWILKWFLGRSKGKTGPSRWPVLGGSRTCRGKTAKTGELLARRYMRYFPRLFRRQAEIRWTETRPPHSARAPAP